MTAASVARGPLSTHTFNSPTSSVCSVSPAGTRNESRAKS
jgi:hypothetical protein